MIRYTTGNLLQSDAEALVNAVNEIGTMGAGIALGFRNAFTTNARFYQAVMENVDVIVYEASCPQRH